MTYYISNSYNEINVIDYCFIKLFILFITNIEKSTYQFRSKKFFFKIIKITAFHIISL